MRNFLMFSWLLIQLKSKIFQQTHLGMFWQLYLKTQFPQYAYHVTGLGLIFTS